MNQIAETLYNQIGRQAFVMLGAKNLGYTDKGISFKIGRNAEGVTHISINYNYGQDLYEMKFYAIRGASCKVKAEYEGVYADQLHTLIEKATGLYTSL